MWENVNPFPHTTFLQQTTLNIFCQKKETLCNWMDNLWLRLENIVAKEEIARFEQFPLLSLCFQNSRLLHRRQKTSIWGKGLIVRITIVFEEKRNSLTNMSKGKSGRTDRQAEEKWSLKQVYSHTYFKCLHIYHLCKLHYMYYLTQVNCVETTC